MLQIATKITSDRLLLRLPEPRDGQTVFEAVSQSLDALREFPASLPWSVVTPTLEASTIFCTLSKTPLNESVDLPYLVFLRDSDTFVGCCGLHRINWMYKRFEIGFWVKTSWSGRGYITESVMALTNYVLTGLRANRLDAYPDDKNIRSCRVLERAGYQLEGVLKNERVDPKGYCRNTRVYALVP